MHPRSSLSKHLPKRSLSSAGLDELDELLHGSDSGHRKRHHSLSSNSNHNEASVFATSSSPSRHEYPSPSSSYSNTLRRPELFPYSEKINTNGNFQLLETRFSNQAQMSENYHSGLLNDNNFSDDHYQDLNNEFQASDATPSSGHEYMSSSKHFSSPNFTSHDPHDVVFEHRLNHDEAISGKRYDHNSLRPPFHRSFGSKSSSPREEYLIQAFGPSGFKLHSTSVSSNDELEDSLSDNSSGNNGESTMTDAENELKMSFNELEADIRGAMHQTSPHQQQHSARLPELTELSHLAYTTPSQGSYDLDRHNLIRNNQDPHHVGMFAQPLDRSDVISCPKDASFYPRGTQNTFLAKTVQNKGNQNGMQAPTKWLRDEDERLRVAVARFGGKNWKMIAETLGNGRTDVQCLHRWNKVLKPGLIKGPWTPEEDRILTSLITRYGVGKIRWCDLALHLPGRIGKQCRERWCNHLDSRIRKGQWTAEEDDMVFRWQQKLGNKWSEIAKLLPGRTENAVKNRYNSAARRKWLMNQANKTASTSTSQTTPTTPQAPLQQQPQRLLHSTFSTHQESNVCNVSSMSFGGGGAKVLPAPSSEILLEHQSHNMIPALGHQTYFTHFTSSGMLSTNVLLPAGPDKTRPLFRQVEGMGDDQSFLQEKHDKPAESGKNEPLSASPSTFVPPPLNMLFPPPSANVSTSHTIHSLTSSPSSREAALTPIFPQFPILAPVVGLPVESSSGEDKHSESSVLQSKDEKSERDDLGLHETLAVSSGHDPGVSMDDENMNSFLDSATMCGNSK
ncbi:transcriptional activator myb-like [Plasmopara halstedii]|uniref:Transcriptional activator myb-like n=1 Tax=Plasmopara halstedii TaxID=4781 RepID=A0A0P1AL10_PLAHL|nr:transcriptional activator myb-like [Plasmopara halstedii]CEG41760.1 transcriptional activator myb-like [Plasmopara halstedii]|eukprot:XP_024578129.1 transcriptional activator myb-like [Plasmopara halstedii]